MNYLFKMKMGMLFFVSAALLPLIMLSEDLFVSATFTLLFIIVQAIALLSFAASDDAGFYEWYSFWLTAIGSVYLFVILTIGRSLDFEIIGFLLFVAYITSAILFLIRRKPKDSEESGFSQSELSRFRAKDESAQFERFEIPEAPKQKHLTEYPDFLSEKKQEAVFKENLQRSWEDRGIMQIDDNEGYYEIKPTQEPEDEHEENYLELYPESKPEDYVEIKELKETPILDVESLRASTQKIERDTKSINEKIRLIAEKAILEGAQKRLEKAIREQKKKPVKVTKVFAAISGDKFHTDNKCISVKRVKKKDIVFYPSEQAAKKQGLKPCGICRRK